MNQQPTTAQETARDARRAKFTKRDAPDWFGCGREITQTSWDGFLAARKAYYQNKALAKATPEMERAA